MRCDGGGSSSHRDIPHRVGTVSVDHKVRSERVDIGEASHSVVEVVGYGDAPHVLGALDLLPVPGRSDRQHPTTDRKSTRLNSSHVAISYAVFCLKKKTI